ncbi:hypothetical protein BDQ17DRAFT_233170 [Cyathus striatus]|nr:hypothetical protein BDQ17DRAFT_233170 [Cyathus striatus]
MSVVSVPFRVILGVFVVSVVVVVVVTVKGASVSSSIMVTTFVSTVITVAVSTCKVVSPMSRRRRLKLFGLCRDGGGHFVVIVICDRRHHLLRVVGSLQSRGRGISSLGCGCSRRGLVLGRRFPRCRCSAERSSCCNVVR